MIYANEGRERAVPSNVRAVSSAQLRIRTRAVPKLVFVAALNAWLRSHSWLDLQTKFLSCGSAGGPAPQVDCQAPSSSHNQPSFTSFAYHRLQFLDRRVVRLPACHPPDHLDEGVTHHRVTAPVNVAFPPPTIAVVDSGAQAGVTGNLTTILEAVPTAELQFERDPA